MVSRRAVIALFLVQVIAFAVSAQQAAEFGRATGGEIVLTPKGGDRFSGSLEFSMSSGNDVLGGGNALGYGLTAGGTLLQDRIWFFASASRQEAPVSRFADLELPASATQNATMSAAGAKINGQLGRGQDFSAFFESARRPEYSTTVPASFSGITPSSFLSLRYTGIVSSNMFFTTSFTRSSRTARGVGILPAD